MWPHIVLYVQDFVDLWSCSDSEFWAWLLRLLEVQRSSGEVACHSSKEFPEMPVTEPAYLEFLVVRFLQD